nr:DUF6118 family protein [Acidomonas methanolica]
MTFLCGLAIAAPLFRVIPWGVNLGIASFIVGETDRWESGIALMKNARPQNWKIILWEDKVVQANIDRLNACQESVNKSNATESCTIRINPQ